MPKTDQPRPIKCPVCNGTGQVKDGKVIINCGFCEGTGYV
jgi:hypothetical protein